MKKEHNRKKRNYKKMILITKIKYVREISNYLLDNFNKEKIRLEFIFKDK